MSQLYVLLCYQLIDVYVSRLFSWSLLLQKHCLTLKRVVLYVSRLFSWSLQLQKHCVLCTLNPRWWHCLGGVYGDIWVSKCTHMLTCGGSTTWQIVRIYSVVGEVKCTLQWTNSIAVCNWGGSSVHSEVFASIWEFERMSYVCVLHCSTTRTEPL